MALGAEPTALRPAIVAQATAVVVLVAAASVVRGRGMSWTLAVVATAAVGCVVAFEGVGALLGGNALACLVGCAVGGVAHALGAPRSARWARKGKRRSAGMGAGTGGGAEGGAGAGTPPPLPVLPGGLPSGELAFAAVCCVVTVVTLPEGTTPFTATYPALAVALPTAHAVALGELWQHAASPARGARARGAFLSRAYEAVAGATVLSVALGVAFLAADAWGADRRKRAGPAATLLADVGAALAAGVAAAFARSALRVLGAALLDAIGGASPGRRAAVA